MQLIDTILAGLAAMLLHETAHMVAAFLFNLRIYQIGVSWRGPYIRRESGTTGQNLAVTLAGPGINIWLAALFYGISPTFALCNLVIGISNLLPIPAWDGSRALRLIGKSLNLAHARRHSFTRLR